MRIEQVQIHVSEVALGGKFYNPRILWTRKQSVFIEVSTSNGLTGWGECWTFDRSADALVRFLQTEIKPQLIGRDATLVEEIWHDLFSDTVLSGRHGMAAAAMSGVDCALWDIAAQVKKQSLGALIARDGVARAVPVYASGGLYLKDGTIDDLQAEMRGYVAAGYSSVKMKFGAKPFEHDLERMRAVREAIGPDTGLIVDAVYSLDRTKAERWLPEWQDLGIEAVQAPFPSRDWDAMQWLNDDVGIPVMVFEAESRYVVFRALLERKAIGVMQFSPIAVGGVTASLALIDLAQNFGKPVSLQCSSTWLAEMIALQIGAARPEVKHVEIHGFHRMLFTDGDPRHQTLKSGCIDLAGSIGTGFQVPTGKTTLFDEGLPDS